MIRYRPIIVSPGLNVCVSPRGPEPLPLLLPCDPMWSDVAAVTSGGVGDRGRGRLGSLGTEGIYHRAIGVHRGGMSSTRFGVSFAIIVNSWSATGFAGLGIHPHSAGGPAFVTLVGGCQ